MTDDAAVSEPGLASSPGASGHASADRPSRTAAQPALVMSGITKRWPRQETPVLDAVDLALEPGVSASISGLNGAGKTTLLRVAAGLIAPDEGTVRLHGLDPQADGRRYKAKLGLLSAGDTGLFARLSVRRHLDYWARLVFIPRSRRQAAIERMLDSFALGELADRRADRLSMGQRQRVRAALAFLNDPELLLLDEAQTSLDGEGMAMLTGALNAMAARGGTAIWCMPTGEHVDVAFSHRFVIEAGCLRRL